MTPQAREFAESFVAVDPVLRAAMAWSAEVGIRPVAPGAGAALRLLAAASHAKSVVEIGTGAGASGLWLLGGMRPDGVLTTIDIEPEHQRLARRSFIEAGHAPSRTRIIAGRALDVLPRLADGGYDLIFIDSAVEEYAACVGAAHRLLRGGGLLVVNRALGTAGRIADPAARDTESVIVREVVKLLRDAEEWLPALLTAGEGLLCAVKR